jgi:multiple antibiotic resistance protein
MFVDFSLIIQIFALLNPMASLPFLIAAANKNMDVRSVAIKSVLVAFIIALTIVFVGPVLFSIFGITIDSFRIAGGIILLLLGINMVRPKEDSAKDLNKINSLIAILATPLLTGPGTISFITIKAFELGKMQIIFNLCFAFVLVAIIFISFSFAIKKINVTVVDIISRVMGLLLTAVAIEMMAKGIEGLIKSVV